jgi:hypothetical protein
MSNEIIPFTTGKCNGVVVKVPDDAVAWEIYDKESHPLAVMVYLKHEWYNPGIPMPIWPIPEGNYSILGIASDLTEEQCKEVVDIHMHPIMGATVQLTSYKVYDSKYSSVGLAESSFKSLLTSIGATEGGWLVLIDKK